MCILNHRILSLDEAQQSLLAIAKKASTQRSIGKDGFKMRINLLHSVLSLMAILYANQKYHARALKEDLRNLLHFKFDR